MWNVFVGAVRIVRGTSPRDRHRDPRHGHAQPGRPAAGPERPGPAKTNPVTGGGPAGTGWSP
jgi:hypothetical protein